MNARTSIVTAPERARLRVEDFMLLAESGAFAEYSKTELIEGEVYYVNAQFSRHARIKTLLATEFNIALRAMGSDLQAWNEPSTQVSDDSMPEPDVVLTRFRGRGPVPLDTVPLIVEVSDTTFDFDHGTKQRIYARAGIPEYWIADCERQCILRLWQSEGDRYARRDKVAFGGLVAAVTVAGLVVETALLLDEQA